MVSLEAVECLAASASPECQHGAIARPDPQKCEAVVLCTPDPALTPELLLRFTRESGFSELAVPSRIVRRENLPLLGTGKGDYVALKEMAGS